MEFSEFFRREADQLLRFCWMLTLDAEEAADLAQEVMERACIRWGELAGPDHNPTGWVRTVAVNLSRSRWRRMRKLTTLLPRLATTATHTNEVASDPDLALALGQLAPRQRQVIALRYWADLPLQECADVMGISLGSIKQHLARAHQNLASVLDASAVEELVL